MRTYINYYFDVYFNKFTFLKQRDFFTQARGVRSSPFRGGGGGTGDVAPGIPFADQLTADHTLKNGIHQNPKLSSETVIK